MTLYKHVRSKEELLCRMFARTIRSFRSGLRHIVEQPLPADEKLRRVIRYQVTQVATQLPLLRVFFSEEGSLPAAMARRVAREKREYDGAIERVVGEGIAEGRVRKVLSELEGPELFALEERVRALAEARRAGDEGAAARLADEVAALARSRLGRSRPPDPLRRPRICWRRAPPCGSPAARRGSIHREVSRSSGASRASPSSGGTR